MPKVIPEIAAQTGIPPDHVINVFGALGGGSKPSLLCDDIEPPIAGCDGIHPNEKGFDLIAQTIFNAVSK